MSIDSSHQRILQDLCGPVLDEVRTRAGADLLGRFKELVAVSDSPIELLLGTHLLIASYGYGYLTYVPANQFENIKSPGGYFTAQFPIASYVLDFAISVIGPHGRRIVCIECDGHDFHERTKQQAAHDKKRDRKLVSLGLSTLRFTGSEIWRDPIHCREEIESVLADLAYEVIEGCLPKHKRA